MKYGSTLRFVKLSKHAVKPTKGSPYAAGYDLHSAYDYTIEPKGKRLCLTDLKVALPEGCYGRIAPRSGLAHKNFIDVGAGVVDYDYRGNVGVILFNFGDTSFEVKSGDRIAQIICEKIYYPEIEEVEDLEETIRGVSGFGSTGLNDSEKSKESLSDSSQGSDDGESHSDSSQGSDDGFGSFASNKSLGDKSL